MSLHNACVCLQNFFLTVHTYCSCLVRHSFAIYCFHSVPKMWWRRHILCTFSGSVMYFISRRETLPCFSITQSRHTPNKHVLLTGQSRSSLRIKIKMITILLHMTSKALSAPQCTQTKIKMLYYSQAYSYLDLQVTTIGFTR